MKTSLTKTLCLVLLSGGAQAFGIEPIQHESLTKPLLAPVEVKIKQLDGSFEVLSLGGSEGHGGDFKEMMISNLAWDIYSKLSLNVDINSAVLEGLKNSISNLEVEVVDQLSLDGLKRDAINLPSQIKIYLTVDGYSYLSDETEPFIERAQFLLHELLPTMGTIDSDYKTSSFLAEALEESKESEGGLFETLYSTHFDYQGNLDFSRANEICESVKKSYKDDYFAVYCTYQEKRHYPYYADYTHRRYHRRTRRFRRYSIVYGLKVIGLGRVDQLRERTLLDGRVVDMPTYPRRAQAMYECIKIVAVQDDHDFSYYKARCEAFTSLLLRLTGLRFKRR